MKNVKKIFLIMTIIILGFCSQSYAESGYTVSFGLNTTLFTSSGPDATNTVNTAKAGFERLGYTSFKYINPSFTRLQSFLPDNTTRMLESDIVLLVGHGTWRSIQLNQAVYLQIGKGAYFIETNTGNVGTNSIDWNKCKVVILMGCNTASSPTSQNNITKTISNVGTTAIGWDASIYDNDCNLWMQRFTSKLAENKTVQEAINHANLFLNYFSYTDYNAICSCIVEGSNNIRLLRNSNTANTINIDNTITNTSEATLENLSDTLTHHTLAVNESNLIHKKYNQKINFDGKDISKIIKIIQEDIKEDFELEDFEPYIIYNGNTNYTISFIYKIGDIYTNLGCSIFIEDNKITDIFNNISGKNLELYTNEVIELNTINNENYNSLKNNALRKINVKISDIKVIKQDIKKTFDVYSKEKKISVLTTYEINDQKYTDVYIENI